MFTNQNDTAILIESLALYTNKYPHIRGRCESIVKNLINDMPCELRHALASIYFNNLEKKKNG